jgi:hypothetical protein
VFRIDVRRAAFLAALVVGLVSACAPPPLEDDDVTVLIPLAQARALLPAGQVMRREVFDQLHPLTVVDEPDALWAGLAVVGVRLDPCFTEGSTAGPCRPQVRLVLQPVMDESGRWTTRDAAVHLFFEVDAANLLRHVEALATARHRRSAEDRLAALRRAVIELVAAGRFSKATQMSVHASNEAWIFAAFSMEGGLATPLALPTLGTLKHHVTSTGGDVGLTATLIPASSVEPAFSKATATAPTDAAREALVRLEAPDGHNPGTVDCGGCHLAATARWHWSSGEDRARLDASFSDTRNLRALGYFFERPAVSPRTRLETTASRRGFERLQQEMTR